MRSWWFKIAALAALIGFQLPSICFANGESIDLRTNSEASPKILFREFGTIEIQADGTVAITPALSVPHNVNQRYGWLISVVPQARPIKWREEFVLPKAPAEWNGGYSKDTQGISKDQLTSTREGVLEIGASMISGIWSVAKGDPTGNYVIRVFLDERLTAVFKFSVQ